MLVVRELLTFNKLKNFFFLFKKQLIKKKKKAINSFVKRVESKTAKPKKKNLTKKSLKMNYIVSLAKFLIGLYLFLYTLIHVLVLITPYTANYGIFMNLGNFFELLKPIACQRELRKLCKIVKSKLQINQILSSVELINLSLPWKTGQWLFKSKVHF